MSLPNFTDPGVPSYVDEGYMLRGYQKYYSTGTTLTPGESGYQPPGTPPTQGISFFGPTTPPLWPTLPPTLPPDTCPPLNSYWSAGPSDIAGNEIGYTPPVSQPNDDGITFPASPGDLILRQSWHGVPSTLNPGNILIYNLMLDEIIHEATKQSQTTEFGGGSVGGGSIRGSYTPPQGPDIYAINSAIQKAVLEKLMQGTGLWYELVLKPLTTGPFGSAYVVSASNLLIPQTIDLSAPSS
jgi:hypothetical protein